jgi:hypothetical protein
MRLRGRTELWHELEHAGWLQCLVKKHSCLEVQLLDAAVLGQTPGRTARTRAAQWALRPAPLAVPPALPSTVQLTTLVLAAHTFAGAGCTDLDALARLCGHSPQQLEDLLDRLVRSRLLAAWHHHRDHDEAWRLPEHGR